MSQHAETAGTVSEPREFGLLAEYETPAQLVHAARRVRDAGFKRWDCHSPFPVHGLDRAMGLRDTRLPWLVLIGGLTGSRLVMRAVSRIPVWVLVWIPRSLHSAWVSSTTSKLILAT